MREIRVFFIGFGNVGRVMVGVFFFEKSRFFEECYGVRISVVSILDISGIVWFFEGIDFREVFFVKENFGRFFVWINDYEVYELIFEEIVGEVDLEIVVDVINDKEVWMWYFRVLKEGKGIVMSNKFFLVYYY